MITFLLGIWYMYQLHPNSLPIPCGPLPLPVAPLLICKRSIYLFAISFVLSIIHILGVSHKSNHAIFKLVYLISFTSYYGIKIHLMSHTRLKFTLLFA